MADSDGEPTLGEKIAQARAASTAAAFRARTPAQPTSDGELDFAKPKLGASLAPRSRKDQPREVSSKRPVPYGRTRCLGIDKSLPGARLGVSRKMLDPRFEEHCGNLESAHVKRNYAFVNDLKARELAEAKKQLQKEPTNFLLRSKVRTIEAQLARQEAEERRDGIRAQLKAEEKEKVKQGKKPFFFKESAVRERELKAKFDDLKARGGIQKYIEKRRKRHASKDRRHLRRRE